MNENIEEKYELSARDMEIVWQWAFAIAANVIPDEDSDPLSWPPIEGAVDEAKIEPHAGMHRALALAALRYVRLRKDLQETGRSFTFGTHPAWVRLGWQEPDGLTIEITSSSKT